MVTGLIVIAIIILIVFWAISIYNKLVRFRNQVKNAWAQIDVQLQRRYDLIPNLVETVKGYMNFEKSTLESVVKARSEAMAAREKVEQKGGPTGGSIKDLLAAEGALQGAMTKFFAVAESYPQLRSSENMKQLQEELSTTENKVAFARQAYNDQVLAYNTTQQQFPAVLLAGAFGHKEADLYEVESAEAKKAVKVSF